ncbi:hypothetical protein VNO78_27037 [Psophocarpus tetragonolobus]|uniref:Uncharacterized protein n=1 Tax=Psophocarpus tetragonolobus TaxID=3891 RepID=A0AAN9S0C8_PSOTE
MMNHSHAEEALSKQREAIVNLMKEIQNQNMNFIDMEHKHDEKTVIMSKFIAGFVENMEFRQRSLMEMENKYNYESLNMIMKLMDKDMHEERHKEVEQLKAMNSSLSHEKECMKKELDQVSKELKEHKALNDLQQKNFNEMIQMVSCNCMIYDICYVTKISALHDAAKQQNDCANVLKID